MICCERQDPDPGEIEVFRCADIEVLARRKSCLQVFGDPGNTPRKRACAIRYLDLRSLKRCKTTWCAVWTFCVSTAKRMLDRKNSKEFPDAINHCFVPRKARATFLYRSASAPGKILCAATGPRSSSKTAVGCSALTKVFPEIAPCFRCRRARDADRSRPISYQLDLEMVLLLNSKTVFDTIQPVADRAFVEEFRWRKSRWIRMGADLL